MSELDFENDVRIDPDSLDTEWLNQPSLMMKYNTYQARVNRALEQAKEKLKVIQAELDRAIRKDPAAFGVEKVTEGSIQSAIVLSPKYADVRDEVIEANYEAEMAKAAVISVAQKKDSLEGLVRLHGQQYFAGPSIPRDLSKEWEAKTRDKTANTNIGKTLRRTK
jgi:hypothetical protein